MTWPAKSRSHQHAGIATDRVSGLHTEPATTHPVGAGFFAPGRDQLLFEVIYRALVIAQRAVNAPRPSSMIVTFAGSTRPSCSRSGLQIPRQHHYEALLAILERAAEAQTHAVPVRTGHPFALRAGIIPVEFELERTVEAGARRKPSPDARDSCEMSAVFAAGAS